MLKLDNVRNNCGFFEVFITGDEKLIIEEEVLFVEDKESRLFVKKTNIPGIFTIGCKQIVDGFYGMPAGYVWASRVGVVNKEFDIALMECYYKTAEESSYRCCAIDLAHLEEVLEDSEYRIDYTPKLHFEEKEPYYRLEKISHDE